MRNRLGSLNWLFRSTGMLLLCLIVICCQSTAENVNRFGANNSVRFALNKPYSEVKNTPDFEASSLGSAKLYGPLIGSFQLVDESTVFRHIKSVQTASSSIDLGIISTREKEVFDNRLVYFKVDTEGIVRDGAVGIIRGGSKQCVTYAAGIVRRCGDLAEQNRSLQYYDNLVRTTEGEPISIWGPKAKAMVLPALGDN